MTNSKAFWLFTPDSLTVFMAYLVPVLRWVTTCTSPNPPTSLTSFPWL